MLKAIAKGMMLKAIAREVMLKAIAREVMLKAIAREVMLKAIVKETRRGSQTNHLRWRGSRKYYLVQFLWLDHSQRTCILTFSILSSSQ